MQTFNIIAACDDCGGIGTGAEIPWAGSEVGREDLKEFRRRTLGDVVIMGRNTFCSIGKPLKDRHNIVITRDTELLSTNWPGIYTAHDFDSALKCADNVRGDGKIWVIGGAEIYKLALAHPRLHRVYISRIRGDFECTVFMPRVNLPQISEYSFSFDNCIDVEVYGNGDEEQYLQLLKRLITAPLRLNRTGIPTRGLFAEKLEFSLTRGDMSVIPLLTTKKMSVRLIISELLWFLGGKCTDTSFLQENNCHIWDGNTTREFLDSRGLSDYTEGECGPIYGYQWRSWNRPYTPMLTKTTRETSAEDTYVQSAAGCSTTKPNAPREVPAGIDQLAQVINTLRTDPFDRRMIVSAWNPEQLPLMALPPCHWSFQFHCEVNPEPGSNQKYTLNCLLNMRSADAALGVPFNIASYALLTHMVAMCVGMRPGRLVIVMADCHLYENHISGARDQISREPGQFSTIRFSSDVITGGEIDQFTSADQIIIGAYQPHPVIKYPMAV